MLPKVSVVLAVYNGGRHLEASVRSILDQTFRDFELIIVDDGSTDGTPEMLLTRQRADQRVVLVRQDHRGLTLSLNRGIAVARGAYIARQDADDISRPERFERQVAYLEAHPSVAALGTAADVIDTSGAIVGALTTARGAVAVKRGLVTLRSTPVHGSVMMRKKALDAVGAYREAFPVSQDYDLWLRLSDRFEIDNIPDVLYQWRLDRDSVYAKRRTTQLQYAGIALAMARERASAGEDSYELLESCDGDLDRFAARYRRGALLHAIWGELLLRGLGNSRRVRRHFRRAVLGGCIGPWTLLLAGWAHFGLPWPGGRPLALADAGDDPA